jgi:hypothetical protein
MTATVGAAIIGGGGIIVTAIVVAGGGGIIAGLIAMTIAGTGRIAMAGAIAPTGAGANVRISH